jgi:hypothetical protein
MSAPNGPAAFDLRCHVREKLIAFLQEKYPESLPRVRGEIAGLPALNDRELRAGTNGSGQAVSKDLQSAA